MNGQDIITAFELYVGDTTELSSTAELTLANKKYHEICDDRPWEFLKKEGSGTLSNGLTITIPSDFAQFIQNMQMTDNSDWADQNQNPVGILVNGNKWIKVVNWDTRRQYAGKDGWAYLDLNNGVIQFTYLQPVGQTYSFDYKMVPPDLTLTTSPIFPATYHPMIYHLMATDDMITQLFDRSRSYFAENTALAASYMQRLALYNANLRQD